MRASPPAFRPEGRAGRRRAGSAVALCTLLVAAFTLTWDVEAWGADDKEPRVVRSLLEMRHDKVVIQKWDLSCGAAALATILAYQHGDPVAERDIAKAMLGRTDPLKVQARLGFSLLDLKRYAESRGYEASGYAELTIDDLVGFAPAIVPVRLYGYNHFVVFRGLGGDRVLLADPAFGNRALRRAAFEAAWVGRMGFIVERRDGEPAPNRLAAQSVDFTRPPGAVLNHVIVR